MILNDVLIYLSDYAISSGDIPQYVPVDTFGLVYYQLISVWRHDSPAYGLFHVHAFYHFIGPVSL